MTPLLSPVSGAPLAVDGAHALCEPDGRRWPVVDGIPYLRTGRDALVGRALAALDGDDKAGALAVLLADQDDWWTGPAPSGTDLATLVQGRDRLTLRAAMDLLGFDRVGIYFAHRWSDPTFLAGLALLEAHWRPASTSFELCCGLGHYGRELLGRGVRYAGADVVFAKLWLARHWVIGPDAELACFDAASPWPWAGRRFDLVFCHDAFYFLPGKAGVLDQLRGLRADGGRVALGHIHNRAAAPLSAGHAVSAEDMAALFPDGTFYDDAELTEALAEGRAPVPAALAGLNGVEAFAVEDGRTPSRAVRGGLAIPRAGVGRLNPLYAEVEGSHRIRWPSPRYEAEYARLATYPAVLPRHPAPDDADALRRRVLVDLPDRW